MFSCGLAVDVAFPHGWFGLAWTGRDLTRHDVAGEPVQMRGDRSWVRIAGYPRRVGQGDEHALVAAADLQSQMVERHLQGGVRGLVRLLDAALQQGKDVVSQHGGGETKQGRARMTKAAQLAVQRRFKPLKHALNGLIANDKFCWARTLQLHLCWSRARNKLKGPAPRHLSAEAVPHG